MASAALVHNLNWMRTCSAGNFALAIKEYTAAIRVDPVSVPAYTNRAAAHLQLEQWQAAIQDCNEALTLLCKAAGGLGSCRPCRAVAAATAAS